MCSINICEVISLSHIPDFTGFCVKLVVNAQTGVLTSMSSYILQILHYPTDNSRPRYMLIINNKKFTGGMRDRLGTEKDLMKLRSTFSRRGFTVEEAEDLSAQV